MAALTRRFRICPGFYRDSRRYHVESRIDSSPGHGVTAMPSRKATGCRPDKKAPATDETAPPSVNLHTQDSGGTTSTTTATRRTHSRIGLVLGVLSNFQHFGTDLSGVVGKLPKHWAPQLS